MSISISICFVFVFCTHIWIWIDCDFILFDLIFFFFCFVCVFVFFVSCSNTFATFGRYIVVFILCVHLWEVFAEIESTLKASMKIPRDLKASLKKVSAQVQELPEQEIPEVHTDRCFIYFYTHTRTHTHTNTRERERDTITTDEILTHTRTSPVQQFSHIESLLWGVSLRAGPFLRSHFDRSFLIFGVRSLWEIS